MSATLHLQAPSSSSSTTSTSPTDSTVPSDCSTGSQATQRSTRGASKQRRDQINVEIHRLRDLLPLSESIKERLFQLQVMSLTCIYIRKHCYQKHILRTTLEGSVPLPKGLDSCKALRGFLIMLNRSGKLLHVSDNASEYLGHSIEEIMCQGDSIFDLVDSRDHSTIQTELNSGPQPTKSFPEERVFLCRLNLARTAKRQLQYHKFMLLQGRYIQPAEYFQALANTPEAAQPIFAAYCQPVINPENAETLSLGNTEVFSSQHFLDMTFKEIDHMCAYHFGYDQEELKGQSWYNLLHPSYIPEVAYKHRLRELGFTVDAHSTQKACCVSSDDFGGSTDASCLNRYMMPLIELNITVIVCQEKEGSVLALIKLRSADGEWLWFHTVFAVRGNLCHEQQDGRRVRHVIHCYYQTLSGVEAATLQANSWIYNIRHTYPAAFPCQGSPASDRPLSPISPFQEEQASSQTFDQLVPFIKQEPITHMTMLPTYGKCGQIKVEIPMKSMPHLSMFTPDNSSPESSASLTSALFAQPFFTGPVVNELNTAMDDFNCILPLTVKGALPDLRDGLDDFFREVEQPGESGTTAVSPSARAKSYSPEQTNDLFKYLGPALFAGGPPTQSTTPAHPSNSRDNRKRSWVV